MLRSKSDPLEIVRLIYPFQIQHVWFKNIDFIFFACSLIGPILKLTSEADILSSFHYLDMTMTVAEALNP